MKNKYCRKKDLHNEASVETFFINRLLKDLGYRDSEIKPKNSLKDLMVKALKTRKKELYRPDFAIKIDNKIKWIIETKSPEEPVGDYIWQARDYCATLNGENKSDKSVQYYLISNGLETRLYRWDYNEPLLVLGFDEFQDDSNSFKELSDLIHRNNIKRAVIEDKIETLEMRKAPIQDVNAAFAWCHQHIYRSDNMSQGAAFSEFVKLIALKLLSDKDIRDIYKIDITADKFNIPVNVVRFSKYWIIQQEKHTPNPMDSILFRNFINDMEHQISSGDRKRIFESDDHIKLSPETIKSVVEKLESIYLFGVDADLNGRLFETFLNATMRGKDLGQYFTPRSLVKLGVGLAQIRVHVKDHDSGLFYTDKIFDGCCGSGGFLIDALAYMWSKVTNNSSLSDDEKNKLKYEIANNNIYGIDVGKDPNLSRIARLNMYLHGDGGSSIFNVDTLDKSLIKLKTDTPELVREKEELKSIYSTKDGFFDVVITNPPFAKAYKSDKKKEELDEDTATRILNDYKILLDSNGKLRKSLRSSVMFYERYYDLLKPRGTLVSVIDDGLLSGSENSWFREFIRSRFIIRAVVSLPGDAFQRSKARVKTSLLVLSKKCSGDDIQPSVFMYPCRYVGIDDPSRQRTLPIDKIMREKAKEEISFVIKEYTRYLEGKGNKKYIVAGDKLSDRFDVKHCFMETGRAVSKWRKSGVNVVHIHEALEPKRFETEDIIDSSEYDGLVTYLRVKYDGTAEQGDEVDPSETTYSRFHRVRQGDIVISNIAATYGSVAVITDDLDGCVVTTEYTVLSAKEGYDSLVLWAILRSPVVRADMLIVATGANRTRIYWEGISDLQIPYPNAPEARSFKKEIKKAIDTAHKIKIKQKNCIDSFSTTLGLISEESESTLAAFKPPK